MCLKKKRMALFLVAICSMILPLTVSAKKNVTMDKYLKKGKQYQILAYNNHRDARVNIWKRKGSYKDKYGSLGYGDAIVVNRSKLKKGKSIKWLPVYLHNRKSGKSYATGYVAIKKVKIATIYSKQYSKNKIIDKAIKTGMKYLGTPFAFGNNSLTAGIDCSNFVNTCYAIGGKRLSYPHTDSLQVVSYDVSSKKLKAGDLIFYRDNDDDPPRRGTGPIGHVSMYIGKGFVIHASGHYGSTYPAGGICIKRIDYGRRVAARYMRPYGI